MSKEYSRVIGIDVSQETLEISDSQSKRTGQIVNVPAVIQQSLLAKIKDKANTLVVCEATGGLEIDLVDLLQENNVVMKMPCAGSRNP